jgi:hypothetical protein
MTTILVNGNKSSSEAALQALAAYAAANPADEFLRANCPNGAPYTLGDLMYVLHFGLGQEGYPVDAEYAAVCARAGVTIETVPQYVVTADAATGAWSGKPALAGRVEMWRWLLKQDSGSTHFDSAVIDGEEAAIEVRWAE